MDVLEDRLVTDALRLEVDIIIIVTLKNLLLRRALRANQHIVGDTDVHVMGQEFREFIDMRL